MHQQRLEVTGLDSRVVTGLSDIFWGHTPDRLGALDECGDGGVREHLGREQLACVLGHEHLSSNGIGARQGPV